MSTGVMKEWYLGGGEWTERELVGIERRMNKRYEPKPDNLVDLEHERVKRTTGGAVAWQAVVKEATR